MSRHTEYMLFLKDQANRGPQPLSESEAKRLRELESYHGKGNTKYVKRLRDGTQELRRLRQKQIKHWIYLSTIQGAEEEE